MNALTATNFNFKGQTDVYHGKVRDVYSIGDTLVMVATDRISAFDVVLPKGIPYKGQMLNQIAAKFLDATADIVPNWKLATPDPMVTVGRRCQGFPVEMIVRGYLCGSAWRAYKNGVREICGVKIPDGMRENQAFATPIITPTTKAELGQHDEDISKEEIIAQLISYRFNPLLAYYENAVDLQAMMRKEPKEEVKPSRRQMRQADKGDTLRLKINRGKNDKMDPRRLLGLINDVVNDRKLAIGDIDISAKFTFFDVPKNRVEQVMEAFATSKRARGIQIALVKGTQGSKERRVEKGERRR